MAIWPGIFQKKVNFGKGYGRNSRDRVLFNTAHGEVNERVIFGGWALMRNQMERRLSTPM